MHGVAWNFGPLAAFPEGARHAIFAGILDAIPTHISGRFHADRHYRPWPDGANIGRRLMTKGHAVVGYDRDPKAVAALSGATAAQNLKTWLPSLSRPAPSG